MSRSIFIAAAMSFVALAAGAAIAQDRDLMEQQRTVSTAKVDFSNPHQVKMLYKRIAVAAEAVCHSEVSDPMTAIADAACEREAVSDAVRRIDAPQLSAIHNNSDRAATYAERSVPTRRN